MRHEVRYVPRYAGGRPGRTSRSFGRGALMAVAAAAMTVCAAGSAVALWSASSTATPQVAVGARAGFAISRVGVAGSTQVATDATPSLKLTLGLADATTMMTASPKAVAIPIKVQLRADGNLGMTYSVAMPSFGSGVFSGSTIRLFPLTAADDAAAAAACSPSAAPSNQPDLSRIVGLAPGHPGSTLATAYWCLSAVYGSGGRYTNVATAQGTASPSPSTAVSASASWSAYVVSEGVLTWTPAVTYPGSG